MCENKISLKYYLIHNTDPIRKSIMINEFNKWGFDLNNINWINHPNKNEISDKEINKILSASSLKGGLKPV